MKIIELLNKIANSEEVPEIIYYSGLVFEWTGLNYYCKKTDEFLDTHICLEDLEQEVEIIEPQEHKIPEKFRINYEIDEEDTINMKEATMLECDLACKINEIIDYLEKIE